MKTFADLFAGIGGFHYAARAAGLTLAYAVERDAAARKNYRVNHGVWPLGDIATLDATALPRADIICAGFPCQPFSYTGARRGRADPRGNLFDDIMRIADATGAPALALENVPGLLDIDGGAVWRHVLVSLQRRGYTVAHRVVDARDLGLPQARRRLLIATTKKPFDEFLWPQKNRWRASRTYWRNSLTRGIDTLSFVAV